MLLLPMLQCIQLSFEVGQEWQRHSRGKIKIVSGCTCFTLCLCCCRVPFRSQQIALSFRLELPHAERTQRILFLPPLLLQDLDRLFHLHEHLTASREHGLWILIPCKIGGQGLRERGELSCAGFCLVRDTAKRFAECGFFLLRLFSLT